MARKGPKPRVTPRPREKSAPPSTMEIPLHATQKTFVECDRPYKALTAGRGSGKSFCGAFDYLIHAAPNTLGLVIAPTYKMLEDSTRRTFVELATKLGLWNEDKFHKTSNTARLNNGHEVLFRSGEDPGKLRGSTVHRIWADECSLLKEDVYEITIACLRWPGAADLTFSGTFTPAGKEHWTYRVFGDATNPNVALFRCSTKDNPFLPPEYYERLLLQYGRGEGGMLRARQELEGEFVCVEGAEWPIEWFGPQVWFDDWPSGEEQIRAVMLDSSKGRGGKSGDYSCFTMAMYSHGCLWIEADMDNSRNAGGMAATAVEIQRTFKPHYFGIEEEFGGEAMADDILLRCEAQNVLIPLVLVPTHGIPKEVRIRRLTPYLARGMVRFRSTEHTRLGVAQMESFPHAQHDDFPDATEGVVRIINESGLL